MLDTAKNTVRRTTRFVLNHRVAIAVVATSAVWMTLQVRNANELNAFLKEHDLFEQYYLNGLTEAEADAILEA